MIAGDASRPSPGVLDQPSVGPNAAPASTAPSPRHVVLLVAILLGAAAVRFAALDAIPPGLYYDEGANGIDALAVLRGDRPIFFPGNQGREPLYIYLVAASFRLFGASALSVRLVSAALGLLTVLATYILARDLYGRRTALLAAAIIAGSFWHISLSRLGFRAVALPLFEALAALCLYRAITRRSLFYWACAGLFGGASMYTYLASRAAPIWLGACAFLALAAAIRARSDVRRVLLGIGLAAVVGAATVAPLGAYFYRHQEQLMGRISAASAHGDSSSLSENVLQSTLGTLGMLFVRGDANPRHNLPARPVFDPALGLSLVAGVVVAARRVHRIEWHLPLIWMVVMLLPGALAADAPHFLRTSGIVPAVYLFPAVGLAAGTDWLARRRTRIAPVAAALLVVASGCWSVWSYFGEWAGRGDVYRAFTGDARDAARLAAGDSAGRLVLASGESYRLQPNPTSLFSGSAKLDRVFDGLKGMIIPSDVARDRLYLFPAGATRDDGAHCPFVPCFEPTAVVPGPDGRPAVGVFEVDGPKSQPGLPPRTLNAQLADNLTLTGYELDPIITPGQVTHLTLHTMIGQPLRDGRDWRLFANLVAPDGSLAASAYGEQLTPVSWQPGDRYIAWFDLLAPTDLRTGLYTMEVSVFDSGLQARLPLSDRGRPLGDALVISPLRVPEPADEVLSPANRTDFRYGDGIALIGYDVALDSQRRVVDLTLYWQASSRPSDDYTVFVHLVSAGRIVAQRDSQPRSGALPTSVWQPGETVVDSRSIPLPEGSAGATLDVVVGVYKLESGERLAARGFGVPAGADAVTLTRLTAP